MGLTPDELESSIYMTLNSKVGSPEGERLADNIVERIFRAERKPSRQNKKLVQAVGAIVADLLKAAEIDKSRYSYRSLGSGSFSDSPIGYVSFLRAVNGMEAVGLLKVIKGTSDGFKGRSTRFRGARKLWRLLEKHGLKLGKWSKHFEALPRPKSISAPLVLKRDTNGHWTKPYSGGVIKIDFSRSPARQLAQQVNRLNAFFADVTIEPAESHFAFRRVFNQGDAPGFAWNKGGRLISLGSSYQQMKADDRKLMLLNGESVVEIDIRASHLTILHALLGLHFDPEAKDPYAHPSIPRSVAKAWVTMTLGYDKFQSRWSKEVKKRYKKDHGGDLQKVHPISDVREAMLSQIPALKDWPDSKVRWGTLQYLESQAVIGAVEILAKEHKVPALPVHDSIIVPASKQKIAEEVLKNSFKKHVGVEPKLSTK